MVPPPNPRIMCQDNVLHAARDHQERVAARVHATTVSIGGVGVMLRGASGSGKSDLALRLIDRGARLVADDVTLVSARGGRAWATGLARGRGLIEARGVGILRLDGDEILDGPVPLSLVVDLSPDVADRPEWRHPEPDERCAVAGCGVRVIRLDPRAAVAPILVERALLAFGQLA